MKKRAKAVSPVVKMNGKKITSVSFEISEENAGIAAVTQDKRGLYLLLAAFNLTFWMLIANYYCQPSRRECQ